MNRILVVLSLLFLGIQFKTNAQEKWVPLIHELDSTDVTDPKYSKLLVEICWQISDLSPDSAMYYGNKALELAKTFNNDSIKCRALLGITGAISRQGKHAEAIEISLEALQLAENIGDTTSIYDAYNNIGIDQYYQENLEEALMYFQKSADYVQFYKPESYKSRHQFANALMNVALTEAELGNTSTEIRTYYQVAGVFKNLGDPRNLGLTLFNIGKAYYKLKEVDSATYYYKESLKIFRDNSWTSAESDVLTNWSELLYDQNKYAKAMPLIHRSLAISKKSNNTLQIQFAYNLIHKLFAAMHQYDSAYYYMGLHKKLYNEAHETEKQEYADELLTKYETEKKERQITQLESDKQIQDLQSAREKQFRIFLIVIAVLLVVTAIALYYRYKTKSKTNLILDAKNKELQELNYTKDRLFSIISHDLKSPLSSFHTITRSLTDNWDNIEKDQMKDFMVSLRDSSKEVHDMMDNLLRWALSQTGQLAYKPEVINPSLVVDEIKKQLQSFLAASNIELNIQMKNFDKLEVDNDYLKLILRNLVSNAIKFSKMDSTIEIIAEQNSTSKIISIKDYGVGIKKEDIEKLFGDTTSVHDIQNSANKGTGLGLTLCKELMEKMGGRIDVESEYEKGSTFKLIFPKAA